MGMIHRHLKMSRYYGESIHDGSITYGSDGDGTIRVYDIPDRWHQQSDEEMREAAEEVLKTIKIKKYQLETMMTC